MTEIGTSPINGNQLVYKMTCKDHTVSGKEFTLYEDVESGLLLTTPRPEAEEMGAYYQSEDYISHTDSKKSLFDKVYNTVRNHTIKGKLNLLDQCQARRGKLLDIGAGTGAFLSSAQDRGWEVDGLEPGQAPRAIAEAKLGKPLFTSTDLSLLPSDTYDIITMWHVLEHVTDVNESIRELKRILKADGTLIIALPNYESFDAQFYKEEWAAYDVPRHLYHFSSKSVKLLFGNIGMQVKKIKGMWFDSFYVALLSEKNIGGISLRALAVGAWSNIKAVFTKNASSLIYIIENES